MDSGAHPLSSESAAPSTYRNYLLISLIVLYAFNYVDSVALAMALPSIKADLHLSDTELGLLSGIAFTLFYAGFGVPLGRWADRGNRITVLFATRLLWAAFVILTGRARSFIQLLILRAGAAVGESGCLPPSYSLISDYYSREERPRAIGLFSLGGPCATLISFFAAGWLTQLLGWRTMFTVIGIPGILFAIATRLTLRETRQRRNAITLSTMHARSGALAPQSALPPPVQPSFWQVLRSLYGNATFRNLLFALVISYFFSGTYAWQPPYFVREYGLKSGPLGTWLAIVFGAPGLVGTALGGVIASQWAKRNERLQLLAIAVLYCIAGIILTEVYLTHDYRVALSLIGLTTVVFALQSGPLFSALQTVVPPHLRAVSMTIVFFFANLIGAGLGPLCVGAASDLLHPMLGPESLRYALAAMGPWFFLSGVFAWRASRSVGSDIMSVKECEHEALSAPQEKSYD